MLLGVASVDVENRVEVLRAMAWHGLGMDFADALHLAVSDAASAFVSFGRDLAKVAKRVSAKPIVAAPFTGVVVPGGCGAALRVDPLSDSHRVSGAQRVVRRREAPPHGPSPARSAALVRVRRPAARRLARHGRRLEVARCRSRRRRPRRRAVAVRSGPTPSATSRATRPRALSRSSSRRGASRA